MADTLLEQWKRSPLAVMYLREVERVLDEERVRRRRFYNKMMDGQTSEFINGEVIIHQPVELKHFRVSSRLSNLITTFVSQRGIGLVTTEKQLICLTRNDYEPDICFFPKAVADKPTPDQMKFPAPDFIVEVLSPSTESNDRGVKLDDYAAHGVREYWIIDPEAETVEQYLMGDGVYTLSVKIKDGALRSDVITGLELSARAIFDDAANAAALKAMLAAG